MALQLVQWICHEVALVHAGVRHGELGGVDDEVASEDYVNIHKAVNVVALLVAVRCATQSSLYLLTAVQHVEWLQVALKHHAHVEEGVVALVAPWLALNNRRHCAASGQGRECCDGAHEIATPVTKVASYIDMIQHSVNVYSLKFNV